MDDSSFAVSFTTETTEKNGNNGMSQPSRAATRNPWPIIRFLAHSRFWASCRRSLSLGEKPKSATLRAKEYERNRLLNCSLNTEAQRHKGTEARRSAPAMERLVRFRSQLFKPRRGRFSLFRHQQRTSPERQSTRVAKKAYNRPHSSDGLSNGSQVDSVFFRRFPCFP